MRLNSLPLLSFLLSEEVMSAANNPALIFFVNADPPQAIASLSTTHAVYSRRGFSKSRDDLVSPSFITRQSNWWESRFWLEEFPRELPANRGSIAIFSASFEEIPPFAIEALLKHNVRDLIYLSFGEWRRVALHYRLSFHYKMWKRKLWLALQSAIELVDLQLRKVLLKVASRHLFDGTGYQPSDGFSFNKLMPWNVPNGDTVGSERSTLLLFEEKTLLQGHQSHDLIKAKGQGRYSHWENQLIFSSTDNTDPNFNGRRYRYVDARGWRKLIAPLFYLSDRHNVTDKVRVVEEVAEVTHSTWKPVLRDRPAQVGTKLRERPEVNLESFIDKNAAADPILGMQRIGGSTNRACMLIGSLAAGGSERQLCYLARGLKARGLEVSVLLPKPTSPGSLHYLPLLKSVDVPIETISEPNRQFSLGDFAVAGGLNELWLLESLPSVFADEVFAIYTHLMKLRPQVLHCWLDHMNVVGAVAGWLAGVPKIILSARSVNPTHFPPLYRDWYRPWYERMLKSPRVTLTANSQAGADSYTQWLKLEPNRVNVVHNGLEADIFNIETSTRVPALRRSLGFKDDAPVLCGVMRFTAEKRPLRFVRLVAELRKRVPTLRAILVGDGPLRQAVERDVKNLGLEDCLQLLGRREDVPQLIGMSDVLLLTSYMEGLPNVLMEAQLLERPVVAPRVGGIPEVVGHGVGGCLCDKDNIPDTLECLERLLTSRELREKMGRDGRRWVLENFAMQKMVEGFAKEYGSSILGSVSSGKSFAEAQIASEYRFASGQ